MIAITKKCFSEILRRGTLSCYSRVDKTGTGADRRHDSMSVLPRLLSLEPGFVIREGIGLCCRKNQNCRAIGAGANMLNGAVGWLGVSVMLTYRSRSSSRYSDIS